ncbi:hypothetical protein GGI04_003395 [Coemansia thaxteri]|uniref:Major facilitator superfamily (MFS) profile domain-containing protein n=1 Tax=Coemansia thaxteri TaxID=2663907 RepID=A0A9W8BCT7_9FUNG|nr:hypothetical protein GGI04_003395 [Coemansia thaxteri]KAJ2002954.1 hypothetical protein H4R26_003336 [Coemansia thaxteri]KAJ2467962.1 hypothetical protein GGI02_003848 [Coemansia sp. RSA 2322]KAJ2484882.1 hypothetical protein EV174_002099 [Coemansia sp. RSA 2320]
MASTLPSQAPSPGNEELPLLAGIDAAVFDINKPIELTAKEQKQLDSFTRKCDRRLLLFVCAGYALDSLNKMALSNAKIAGLTKDLDLHGYDINVALGVYYLGSFIFQLPSNLVLKRLKPSYWLCGSMFAWSLATLLTARARSAEQLAACRFVFGAVQAGYLTGSLYYISYWYPRDLVRQRMGFFYASAGLGGICIGPLCAALTSVEVLGLRPWQNIFLFVGSLSLVWSVVGLFVLQDYPDTATFITDDERRLIGRLMVRQNTVASSRTVSLRQAGMAIRDSKIWLWTLIDFCANGATQVNGMFGPTIIASQGYSIQTAQLLTALTNFLAFSGMASIAYVAKYTRGSSTAIALSNVVTIVGFLVALLASGNTQAQLAALFLFSFASPQPAAHGPAWEMANQQGSTKPAMAAALTSAFGGLGPLATAFVYRDRDSPTFVMGHSVCLAMTVVCLLTTVVLRWKLGRENTRRDHVSMDISRLTIAQIQDMADNHPDFRYTL